jgi:hypothetical protein
VLSFDLSGKGAPTSSYATAVLALRIIAPHKPPYPAIMPSSRWRYLKEDIGVLVRDFILKLHPISELKTSFQSNIDRTFTATLTKHLHNFII